MDPHFLDVWSPDNIIVQRNFFPPDATHSDPYELVQANVRRVVVWHSPNGFDCAASTPGTFDLALNILQHFLPGTDYQVTAMGQCSKLAAHLHMLFAEAFLVQMPREGGWIPCRKIRDWIEFARVTVQLPTPRTDTSSTDTVLPATPEAKLKDCLEDLKRLTRLTADFLFLSGRRVQVGVRIPNAGPRNTAILYRTLSQLNSHLSAVESKYGVPLPTVRDAG